ncbi:hypothetical protein [Streptomyces sp. NPDC059802]
MAAGDEETAPAAVAASAVYWRRAARWPRGGSGIPIPTFPWRTQ